MTHYVLGFAFRHDNSKSVAMILKKKPDYQAGKYNGIGGHVEENETYHGAMVREFKEESGVEIKEWRYFGRISGYGAAQHRYVIHLFASSSWEVDGLKTTAPQEGEVKMIHLDDIHERKVPMMHNIPWLAQMAWESLQGDFMPRFFDVLETP